MEQAIGGYFEVELRQGKQYHEGALGLNTARYCFEYILKARNYKKVYLPYYTCGVMLEPLRRCGISWEFYHLNECLELDKLVSVNKDEAFLYTNYFGLKQSYVTELANFYEKQLIVDNAQAFFAVPPEGSDTFYSARKFFGVPDGSYLYTTFSLKKSLKRCSSRLQLKHLIGRLEEGPEAYYADFCEAEERFCHAKLGKMSKFSEGVLSSLDYTSIKDRRRSNFNYLHRFLNNQNKLKFPDLDSEAVPMVYPFYNGNKNLREILLRERIFVPVYWNNVLEWCDSKDLEYQLARDILPLPIDQRYGKKEMDRICQVILAMEKQGSK